MNVTRKSFLIGSMSVAVAGARRMFAAPAGTVCGKPRLKLGVLSDIHVVNADSQAVFIRALEWYRAQGVDAVLVAGDMAHQGLVSELQLVEGAFQKVFPGNKTPDGRPLAKLLQYGNHDLAETFEKRIADPAERARRMVRYDPKGSWERVFGEGFEQCFAKEVAGYTFIGDHWPIVGGVGDWLAANGKRLDPSRPFFYFQHSHPKDTCYGAWAWGHDDGASTKALSKFPNAIALSGHSHYSLTDERTVWQGAFTSIGTGSLSYTSTEYNFRENGAGNSWGRREARPHQMKGFQTRDGKQAMLFTVCDDHIRIERREFTWGESLGDDWILPVGAAAEKPFAHARRTRERTAPEFAPDAVARAEFVSGPKKPTHVSVTFPSAEARNKCRVFEYEVQAVVVEDDVELVAATRRVLAQDFYLPEAKSGKPGECVFACAELPRNANLRFDVRPMECFGGKGRPIRSNELKTVVDSSARS